MSTYRAWYNMLGRCKQYGSSRTAHCYEEIDVGWESYKDFIADMGEAPAGMYLDRIDNNKGYFKENCRWVSPKDSARNTSRVKLTQEKADEIRQLYHSGRMSQNCLASLFGVSRRNIRAVLDRVTWNDDLKPLEEVGNDGQR